MDDPAPEQADGSQDLLGEVVFEGAHADMTWQVRVHGDQEHLHSVLYLYRGAKMIDGSGMGGSPLPAGALFTAMRGYTYDDGNHAPANVLVRAHPDVIAAVVTTERNARVPVTLSGVIQPWNLCFGVAILDQGETTGGISIYTADGEQAQPLSPA